MAICSMIWEYMYHDITTLDITMVNGYCTILSFVTFNIGTLFVLSNLPQCIRHKSMNKEVQVGLPAQCLVFITVHLGTFAGYAMHCSDWGTVGNVLLWLFEVVGYQTTCVHAGLMMLHRSL